MKTINRNRLKISNLIAAEQFLEIRRLDSRRDLPIFELVGSRAESLFDEQIQSWQKGDFGSFSPGITK